VAYSRREFLKMVSGLAATPLTFGLPLGSISDTKKTITEIKNILESQNISLIGLSSNSQRASDYIEKYIKRNFSELVISVTYSKRGDFYFTIGPAKSDASGLERLLNEGRYKDAQDFANQVIERAYEASFIDNGTDGKVDSQYSYTRKPTKQEYADGLVLILESLKKLELNQ